LASSASNVLRRNSSAVRRSWAALSLAANPFKRSFSGPELVLLERFSVRGFFTVVGEDAGSTAAEDFFVETSSELTLPYDSPGVLLKQFRHQPDSSWNPSGPMKQFRLFPWPIGQQTRVSLRSALGLCPQTSLCLSALAGNFVLHSSSAISSPFLRDIAVPFLI
jgi:hypothetical protein